MERYEVRQAVQSAVPAWIGMDAELRSASAGLATATLVVILLCATREGFAQTGAASDRVREDAAPDQPRFDLLGRRPSLPAERPAASVARQQGSRELEALLAVRSGSAPITARQTDEAIVAAAARGLAKELEKPQPFRRKNTDLFRTQRAVQLGNQEMLLRLRLRANTRNAMSVELRF